jgi:hypothetical protein
MRMALPCMTLVLLCCGSAEVMGQEIIYSPEVLQKQQHVPESVIYGILLHQAAAFKDNTDKLDRSGGDGSPYRHHMEAKFGLTSQELIYLNKIAIEYRAKVTGPESDLKKSVVRFRVMNANLQRKGKALPPPSEAELLLAKIDGPALHARDEFHALVGDSEFARIDALVKYRVVSHLQDDHSPSSANGGSATARKYDGGWKQGVLGYTSIDFDAHALEVTAYSETDIYGDGMYYYEPIVSLDVCGETEMDRAPVPWQGSVFVTLECRGNPGIAYSAFSTHSVEIDSEYLGLKDGDTYGLGRWDGIGVMEPFSFPFTSFSPETDMGDQTINLGKTYSRSFWSDSPKPPRERSSQSE